MVLLFFGFDLISRNAAATGIKESWSVTCKEVQTAKRGEARKTALRMLLGGGHNKLVKTVFSLQNTRYEG